ncbi:hypothetical protein [Roseobacter sinensis]|uniref:Secreted protein n=1 Tax=Roseobacter sinensis TaxID=2931391 RepID=A0ABT3BLC6_9RHOB|nr:hypothetical protein [Roseobacter sp. WL0113]MCV3274387.1 hypothetical protein [Roseobacter sp. WL0113]
MFRQSLHLLVFLFDVAGEHRPAAQKWQRLNDRAVLKDRIKGSETARLTLLSNIQGKGEAVHCLI